MEKDDHTRPGMGTLSSKLEKTNNDCKWLMGELDRMRGLNPNSEYITVLSAFQHTAEGIEKVSLDPVYDQYEVVPKKIVAPDKVGAANMLVGSRRDEGMKRHEKDTNNEVLSKLFKCTEKDLRTNEQQLNHVYKEVCVRSDSCRSTCKGLLSKLDAKTKELKSKRKLKENIYKGDYMVVNERGYQQIVDEIYTYLKMGPSHYVSVKEEHQKVNQANPHPY